MSNGNILPGQTYDRQNNIVVPYTQQMCDEVTAGTKLGNAATDVTPQDANASLVKVYDLAAIAALLSSTSIIFDDYVNLNGILPDILTSIDTTYNSTFANGFDSHPASQQMAATEGEDCSLALHPRATAQGSASVLADVNINIKQYWASKVPCTTLLFYVPDNSTQADIITKLLSLGYTALALPIFKPEAHTLTVKGQHISVSVNADTTATTHLSNSNSSSTLEWGNGASKEVGTSIKKYRIPPTLHGAITISSATATATTSVTVEASTTELDISGTSGHAHVDATTNAPAAVTGTATGSVTPTSLLATSPTGIPTTGYYIVEQKVDPYEFGFIRVLVQLVNFAIFA